MKTLKKISFYSLQLTLFYVLIATSNLNAADSVKVKPIKHMFAGSLIIDNQTCMVPNKSVFEFVIQHRFGLINNGYKDFLGLYAPSNIRLGFSYVPINNLAVGIGFTKERMMWDVNAKYSIIKQSVTGGWPLSVTYYGNVGIDTREKAGNFVNNIDRVSYFHQLMFARKITKKLSVQVAPSMSYYNNVPAYNYNLVAGNVSREDSIQPTMNNAHIAMAFLGSYEFTDKMAVIVNYDQPMTTHFANNPRPNVSFGIQMATATHTFQIFLGNYQYIVPQVNNFYNQNNFKTSRYCIGFNITKR